MDRLGRLIVVLLNKIAGTCDTCYCTVLHVLEKVMYDFEQQYNHLLPKSFVCSVHNIGFRRICPLIGRGTNAHYCAAADDRCAHRILNQNYYVGLIHLIGHRKYN